MKKKIGILIPQFNKASTGGQKYDFYLINQIKKNGQELVLITDNKLKFSFFKFSFFYNFIYLLNIAFFNKLDVLIINSRLYPRLFIFIHYLKFTNKNLKIISIHHHYNFLTKSGILKHIHKFLELRFLGNSDSIIIPSPFCKKQTEEFFPSKKINFLEIAFPEISINIKQITKEKKCFLFIGNVEQRKGLEYLIKALNIVKIKGVIFKMHIVGKYDKNNGYYRKLKEEILDYKLEKFITFDGRLSDMELSKLKEKSSMFLFPSLHEGYGMVLAEVMYYGTPVIAFDNSAMPFIIKNNYNGLLVENKDYEKFADAIIKLYNDTTLLTKMSENCINFSQQLRTEHELNIDINYFINFILFK